MSKLSKTSKEIVKQTIAATLSYHTKCKKAYLLTLIRLVISDKFYSSNLLFKLLLPHLENGINSH